MVSSIPSLICGFIGCTYCVYIVGVIESLSLSLSLSLSPQLAVWYDHVGDSLSW